MRRSGESIAQRYPASGNPYNLPLSTNPAKTSRGKSAGLSAGMKEKISGEQTHTPELTQEDLTPARISSEGRSKNPMMRPEGSKLTTLLDRGRSWINMVINARFS